MLRFTPVWNLLGRDNTQGVVPDGAASVEQWGHRNYVGGLWDELGQLQLDFLVKEGMAPGDTLLDVACGSLRGGRLFIPYLDPGNYLGIDISQELIDAGVREELTPEIVAEKRPEFVASGSFEFERFSKTPDIAIAQSLFTHLPPRMIRLCLRQLHAHAPRCRFYATFQVAPRRVLNPDEPNSHHQFRYTRAQIWAFGRMTGWRSRFIGDWGHPRGQQMVLYTARS